MSCQGTLVYLSTAPTNETREIVTYCRHSFKCKMVTRNPPRLGWEKSIFNAVLDHEVTFLFMSLCTTKNTTPRITSHKDRKGNMEENLIHTAQWCWDSARHVCEEIASFMATNRNVSDADGGWKARRLLFSGWCNQEFFSECPNAQVEGHKQRLMNIHEVVKDHSNQTEFVRKPKWNQESRHLRFGRVRDLDAAEVEFLEV